MGTADSAVVGTAVGNQAGLGAVSEMDKDGTVQMKTQPEVVPMIVWRFTKSDKRMSPVGKSVATTVEQEANKAKYA